MGLLGLQSEVSLTECRKKIFAIFALSFLVFVVYSNTFNAGWQFDDNPNILNRKAFHLTKLAWPNVKKSFFNEKGVLFRPIACFSFALNYYFGRDRVFGYHLVNMSIHMLTSIFLFLFIYHGLNLPALKARYIPNRYAIALLAAVLWAINPIQTQAVTYIVQRMASMAGMFYILCMYLYLEARTSTELQSKVIFFVACSIAAFMAMGCKENAFLIPVSIYIFELVLLRSPSEAERERQLRTWTTVLLLSLGICLLLYLLIKGDGTILGGYEKRAFTLKERLLSQPRIVLFYLTLILYPAPTRLSVQHDIPISKTLLDPPSTLLSILLIIGILLSALYFSKKHPFISFSLIFFFLNHLIESSFLPLELVFEHRNYIPSMFLLVPVAMLLWHGIHNQHLKTWTRGLIALFVICLIVAFGHGTYVRNFIWKTEESLWMNATERAPGLWRPWQNLGKYYAEQNKHQKTLSIYFKALSKKSGVNKDDKKMTHYNIAHEYQKLGKEEKALFHYRKAKRIDPSFVPALNNLGVLLSQKGQKEEAIRLWKKAIRSDDKVPEPYLNLGYFYLKTGQIDEAIQALEKCLELLPGDAMALKGLGSAYRKKGLFGKAYLTYQRALALTPQDLSLSLYLAGIFAAKGMGAQKEKAMERFVRFLPEAELYGLIEDLTAQVGDQGGILIDREVAIQLISEALLRRGSHLIEEAAHLDEKTESGRLHGSTAQGQKKGCPLQAELQGAPFLIEKD